jgi:hypothetical protein
MKYKSLLFIVLSFLSFYANAQLEQRTKLTNVTKINLLNPGISYERKINANQTIYFNAFYNPTTEFLDRGLQNNFAKIIFEPTVALQYRFYYNIPLRAKKLNERNSYNYVCPIIETSFGKRSFLLYETPNIQNTVIYKIGALWGIQRNYKSRFSLDFNIGVGYKTFETIKEIPPSSFSKLRVSTVGLLGHLNVGFYIGPKNRH